MKRIMFILAFIIIGSMALTSQVLWYNTYNIDLNNYAKLFSVGFGNTTVSQVIDTTFNSPPQYLLYGSSISYCLLDYYQITSDFWTDSFKLTQTFTLKNSAKVYVKVVNVSKQLSIRDSLVSAGTNTINFSSTKFATLNIQPNDTLAVKIDYKTTLSSDSIIYLKYSLMRYGGK